MDVLYPRFWLFDPPDIAGTWTTSAGQIKEGIETVRSVAQGRCRVFGGLICASLGGEVTRHEMAILLLQGARAVMDAGADGIAIHRVDTIVALDLWAVVKKISRGEI